MFQTNIRGRTNWRAVQKRYAYLRRQRLRDVGDTITADYQKRAWAGIDIFGNAQKPNKPATRIRKMARRGHATPLIDEWVLYKANLWRIRVTDKTMTIAAPANRSDVVGHLISMGYRPPGFFGPMVAPELEEEISRIIGSALTEAIEVTP
jgi:hypothetical protein